MSPTGDRRPADRARDATQTGCFPWDGGMRPLELGRWREIGQTRPISSLDRVPSRPARTPHNSSTAGSLNPIKSDSPTVFTPSSPTPAAKGLRVCSDEGRADGQSPAHVEGLASDEARAFVEEEPRSVGDVFGAAQPADGN